MTIFNKAVLFSLFTTFSCSVMADESPSPRNVDAIWYLNSASLFCAAVNHVNPEVVPGSTESYLNDSVVLFQYFHGYSHEEARARRTYTFNYLTTDRMVESRSLKTKAGATAFYQKHLDKTEAKNCQQIHAVANKMLSTYGLSLDP